MNTIDSIIFDVDGTLWESTGIIAKVWSETVTELTGIPTRITQERLKGLFGQLLSDIAKQLFPDKPEEEQLSLIDACCQAEHRALLKECAPLYPELEEALKILSSKYPLYIVSNCQAGYIEVFLTATGFDHYFQDHLCPGDTGNKKAENISEIVKKHHLKSPVYVGDTSGDHTACKKANVPFVFASYGFGETEHPDYTIASPMDLTKLF